MSSQAATVGSIPGSFDVGSAGAAVYSIPITVPPGTAGWAPKISLRYSTQNGNGIAGVGWLLGGLSAITRCPQTIVHDGAARSVQLDDQDRFCLDGQRLILVSGAGYGAIGAEYRSEIESFSKIVSYGGSAGDPQYFKVWTKGGRIVEYGNTADSRAEAQGKTVAVSWAANKISDHSGNYLAFAYSEDNAGGEHYLASIDYTGNGAAGLAPYNRVEFQYEARPDPYTGYLAGSLVRQTQRLGRIQVRANGALVHEYTLAYETGAMTGRTRLASLTHCAADGTCLPATAFAWQEGQAAALGNEIISNAIVGTTADTWFASGDVNGDGRTDFVTFNTSRDMRLYISDANGSVTQAQQFISPFVSVDPAAFNPGEWRFFLADLDGDGYAEPATCGVAGYYTLAAVKAWVVVPWSTQPQANGQASIAMKASQALYLGYQPYAVLTWKQWCMPMASADGRDDLNWYASEYWKGFELFSNVNADASYGGASFTQEGANVPLSNADYSVAHSADLDGDGTADMVRYDPSTGALFTWLQRNGAFALATALHIDTGSSPQQSWFLTADVNGDGLDDMVLHMPADGGLKVWLSLGNGGIGGKIETAGFDAGGQPSDTWFLMVDVNADGRPDAVKYRPDTGAMTIALGKGDGSFGPPAGANVGAGPKPTLGLGPAPTTGWFSPADVNGDGLPDWVRYDPPSGKIKVNLGLGAMPDLLVGITDGLGAIRTITYKPLTDPSVYAKGLGATYPEQDFQAAMHVVAETAADDGAGGNFRIGYRYFGARRHLTGRGFLGFSALEQTDLQTGIVTRTEYSQIFPNVGQPLRIIRTTGSGVELSRVENTPAYKALNAGKTFFPYISYAKAQGKDLSGAVLPVSETWSSYDDWGNLTQAITQTDDGHRRQADNTYGNDSDKWLLGRLTRATITSTVAGTAQTRVSAFEYDPATGLLTREIIEPDQPQYRLETAYEHDAFGNRKKITTSSPAAGNAAIAARSSATAYDAKGCFAVTASNAFGHAESRAYDERFATVTQLTGPNGLVTQWQYDSFGRKTLETRADGTQTAWTYDGCDAACPASGAYRVVAEATGQPAKIIYFDRLNRELRQAVQGFDGRWIYRDTEYDHQGRVARVSRPYYAGDPAYWATREYDDLGRVVKVYEPDVPDTPALAVAYDGLTVSRTDRKGQTTTEVRNSQGQKISVTDAMGHATGYAYDPFGNLSRTSDPAGKQIVNLYDIRGRKVQADDPDLGLWTYEYNVLGELVQQTDAKAQITTFQYDLLGRLIRRVEPGMTSDWAWDSSPTRGKGKLHYAQTSAGYIRTHYYDDKGRPQLVLHNLGPGEPLLWNTFVYDAAGRLSEQWYPPGSFGVRHVYNAIGYLTEVRNANSQALYWRLDSQDAEGHATKETYGNGVVASRSYDARNGRLDSLQDIAPGNNWIQYHYHQYDAVGNVSGRLIIVSGDLAIDSLTYDAANRLTQDQRNINGVVATEAVTYDALGNITGKTGVGAYAYGDPAHKHAVTQAGGNAYSYDANGNLLAGGGRTVTWASWNLPASLSEARQVSSWLYGPEHARYKMTGPGRTTWYLNPGILQGGHYEQTQYASGTIEHRHTLYGAGRPIGEVLSFSNGPAQTRYFHSDAQGSIIAVTDSNAALLTRYRYDPWGKQTLVSGSNTGIAQMRQGHTGHEMLDGGLTHMNGRLYDPALARFISADPVVDTPYDLQSLNRYGYVGNNPLGSTDPTGYFRLFGMKWSDLRDRFVKPAAVALFAWQVAPVIFTGVGGAAWTGAQGATGSLAAGAWAGTVAGGAAAGAATGAVAGGLYSGSWQGVVQGARYGAIGGAVMGPVNAMYGSQWNLGRVAVQSLVGGVSARLQGGSFVEGLRSSAINSGLRYVYNAAVNYDVDIGPGGNAVKKEDPLAMPAKGANNIGTAEPTINPKSWLEEGGIIPRIANQIPSINAIAGMHDVFQVRLQDYGGVWARHTFNVPGMPLAAAITWGGLRESDYLSYDTIRRIREDAR